ncbi:MAG: hypothetical protein JXA94_01990 [Parachlamydiales bacterium]|nr:hypothetical protein [Parachlamydiales bacterium]
MHQVHFIQKLYSKFFAKSFARGLKLTELSKEHENLSEEAKEKLANEHLSKAEELLKNEDLSAIKLFNEAAQLDPSNPLVWYRQGLAFFEYGSQTNNEKAFLLASKNFKIAVSLDSNVFDYWWAWGNVLFVLGATTNEHHYFLEAKKKYKSAILHSQNQTEDILSELFWDFGLIYSNISDHSGEAIDLKKAIEAFQKSFSYQKDPSSSFFYDLANAYFKMGLLINETNIYMQAIEYLKLSILKSQKNIEAHHLLAETYCQLYLNTLDDEFFNLANAYFEKSTEINPLDYNIWLDWANLLGESGKINKDVKKIRESIEKCIRANRRNKDDYLITAQWVESLSLLGAYSNRLDLISEAENKIMKATEIHCEEADLWYAYGICQKAFGIYYQDMDYNYFAIEKFQIGLSIDRTHAELWHELAQTHAELGKEIEDIDLLERSQKFYLKALDLKPACPSLIFDYAKALSFLGEFTDSQQILEESIKNFETALNIQKNAILNHPDWLYYYAIALDLLADHLEKESYYLKAIELFNSVLLVNPDYPKIHLKLGLCFTHLLEISNKIEYFEKANNCFKLACKQDIEDQDLWLEWGLMLMTYSYEALSFEPQRQLYLEAEQKIIKAGQLGNQHAYYHLACLYSLTERFSESIDLLEKAQNQDMLPPIEEMLEDEWLDPLRETELFHQFLYRIEKKQNI